jgi:hypothetical protein
MDHQLGRSPVSGEHGPETRNNLEAASSFAGRRLVSSPEVWRWSSYHGYAFAEIGSVTLNDWPEAKLATKAIVG